MNGFKKTLTQLLAGAGLIGAGGCWKNDVVDPCWPERYNHVARYSVMDTVNLQTANGHALDQTIWNWQFETELDPLTGERRPTARLHPAGMDHLKYLVQRTPCVDPRIFLQTAHEISFDADNVEGAMKQRADLDARRQQAVYGYLSFIAAGRGTPFQVAVVDPAEVGIAATPIGGTGQSTTVFGAVQQMYGGFRGTLSATAGTFTSGAPGGASGAGSSGSSGSGSSSSGVPR